MKLRYFQPKSVEDQTRLLASHLPSGRVWNSKTGRNLWKLVNVMAYGLNELWRLIYLLLTEFRIETSVSFLEYWEESLGITTDETLSLDERRKNVKAQLRKITVVSKEEWEEVLSTALGKDVSVYPARDIDMTDARFTFPYTFPIYFYPVDPDRIKQSRFTVYVDSVTAEEKVIAKKIIDKFKPTMVRVIYILGE